VRKHSGLAMLPARLDRVTDQSWLRADAQALAIPDKAGRPSIQLRTQRLRETLRAHGTREQPTANTLHHHAVALRIPLDPAEIIADSPGKSFDETVRSRTGAARMTLRPHMIADDARIDTHVLEAQPTVPRTEARGGADALTGAWAEGSRAVGSGMTLGGSRSVSGVAVAPMSAYADNRTAWGHAISREQHSAWAAPAGATAGRLSHGGAIGAAGSHSVSVMPGSPQAGPRAPAAVRLVTGEVLPMPAQLAAAAVAGATIRQGALAPAVGATSALAMRETDYFSQTRSGGGYYTAAPARTPLSPFSDVPRSSSATATPHLGSDGAANAAGGSDGGGRWSAEASGNPYEMFAAPDTRDVPLGPLQRRILAEGEVHVQAVAREEKAARLALLRAERARATAHPRGVLGGGGVGNGGGGAHSDLADAAARRARVLAGLESHDARRRQRWLRCDDSVSRRGYDIITLKRGPVPSAAPGLGQAAAAAGGAGGGSGGSDGAVVGGWYAGSAGGAAGGDGSAGGSEGSSRATPSGRSASAQNPGIRGGLRLWAGQPAAAAQATTTAADGAAAAADGAGASDNLRRAALADGSLLAAGMHRRRTIATVPSHPLWQDTRTVLTGRGERHMRRRETRCTLGAGRFGRSYGAEWDRDTRVSGGEGGLRVCLWCFSSPVDAPAVTFAASGDFRSMTAAALRPLHAAALGCAHRMMRCLPTHPPPPPSHCPLRSGRVPAVSSPPGGAALPRHPQPHCRPHYG